jgi:arsenate reductase
VQILENSRHEYETIDYINSPPSQSELQSLADKMGIRAKDFIRSRESEFQELNLKAYLDDDATLFKYMSENPKLIERPIVVRGDKAVLGRPPEKVEDLLKA